MEIDNQSIKFIINDITPLYNRYKTNKNVLNPVASIEIMWDIGEIIGKFILKYGIQPHSLYRKIYGKSEGKDNIIQNSYLTREFLGRCYRIRKFFRNRNQIKEKLPNLKNFTSFRESMPFIDNPKYIKYQDKIFNLLNSELNSDNFNKILKEIKLEHNPIKNPRTQKLFKVKNEIDLFNNSYNYLQNLIKSNDYNEISIMFPFLTDELAKNISKFISAIISEEIVTPKKLFQNYNVKPFNMIIELIESLFSKIEPINRNRFRRQVKLEKISFFSEMIYSLNSQNDYHIFKSRFLNDFEK